jgi:hypothetical protein
MAFLQFLHTILSAFGADHLGDKARRWQPEVVVAVVLQQCTCGSVHHECAACAPRDELLRRLRISDAQVPRQRWQFTCLPHSTYGNGVAPEVVQVQEHLITNASLPDTQSLPYEQALDVPYALAIRCHP